MEVLERHGAPTESFLLRHSLSLSVSRPPVPSVAHVRRCTCRSLRNLCRRRQSRASLRYRPIQIQREAEGSPRRRTIMRREVAKRREYGVGPPPLFVLFPSVPILILLITIKYQKKNK